MSGGLLGLLGFGGTSSKTTAQVLTEASTQVTADSILSCATVATQEQMIGFYNVQGNVTISNVDMSQGVAVSLSCVMEATKQADIASKVADAIAQTAESKGQAVLSAFGNTRSEASTNIQNQIMSNISANTSQELNVNVSQQQSITAANVGGNVVMTNVTMEQSSSIIAAALMKTSTYSQVINESAAKMDQKSSTEEKNPLADVIKALGGIFTLPIIIIGGIILGIVLIFVIIKVVAKK
jgi:hypothetical protein